MNESPPFTDSPFDVDLAALCASSMPACEVQILARDYVRFFPSYVDDQFRPGGGPILNNYAASESIFNAEFSSYTDQTLRSVNRFTFAKAHEFLIPRAVGYSAGLINYFFRGNMEISLPDQERSAIISSTKVRTDAATPVVSADSSSSSKNVTPGLGALQEEPEVGSKDRPGKVVIPSLNITLTAATRPDLSGRRRRQPFQREYVSLSG